MSNIKVSNLKMKEEELKSLNDNVRRTNLKHHKESCLLSKVWEQSALRVGKKASKDQQLEKSISV